MKKITVIYPKPPTEIIRLKKVAAYCRVSTKQEIQERSLEVQKAYFHESIPKKPDWIFVGVYADEASGRHNKKMKDFQRMMRDCRDGKIDLILVKSISRLGRNNPFGVVIATILGIPMYADIFGMIPIAEALLSKGALLGVVLSFMMAVTTLSLPSMIMLKKAVKGKLPIRRSSR